MSERDEAESKWDWEKLALLYMPPGQHYSLASELQAIASRAREEEREACAKECLEAVAGSWGVGDYVNGFHNGVRECAERIRQRGAKAGTEG